MTHVQAVGVRGVHRRERAAGCSAGYVRSQEHEGCPEATQHRQDAAKGTAATVKRDACYGQTVLRAAWRQHAAAAAAERRRHAATPRAAPDDDGPASTRDTDQHNCSADTVPSRAHAPCTRPGSGRQGGAAKLECATGVCSVMVKRSRQQAVADAAAARECVRCRCVGRRNKDKLLCKCLTCKAGCIYDPALLPVARFNLRRPRGRGAENCAPTATDIRS